MVSDVEQGNNHKLRVLEQEAFSILINNRTGEVSRLHLIQNNRVCHQSWTAVAWQTYK
jgi:hypothetical protein